MPSNDDDPKKVIFFTAHNNLFVTFVDDSFY